VSTTMITKETPLTGEVVSRDGTRIAYTGRGHGAPVILVDGALCSESMGPMPKLAELLADRFTVFTYNRRGRGPSGDVLPYTVQREVDDLEAMVAEAGGTANVFGHSSGAALAVEAAKRISTIDKLVLYEAPFIVDDSREALPRDFGARLSAMLAEGRRGDAVKAFMRFVGVPRVFLALMPVMPMWSKVKAVAHTLPYDIAIVSPYQTGAPLASGEWASVSVPTVVIDGGKSPAWMRAGNRALAEVVPGAQYRTLAGQSHMLRQRVAARVLAEIFGS
jgi:pimeloyl-ACP methyl ester carboxylesterase